MESNNVKRIFRSANDVLLGEADARVQNFERLDGFFGQVGSILYLSPKEYLGEEGC